MPRGQVFLATDQATELSLPSLEGKTQSFSLAFP